MFESSAEVAAAEARFPELAAAIAAIPARPESGRGGAVVGAEIRALLVMSRQLEARLAAHVASFDQQGLAQADASASTVAWLRAFGRIDSGQAATLVRTGRVLEVLPELGAQFAAGVVGAAHVAAVAFGASRLPDEILATADRTLADFAGNARPSDLRRIAARLQACYDEASVADDAEALYESRHLGLSQTFEDAWHLEGRLDPEGGAALDAALGPLMTPRGPEDVRNAGQRRADALVELVGLALRAGELPECGGDRPRLTFTVGQVLLGGALAGVLGRTATVTAADLIAGVTVGCFGDRDAHLLGSGALLPGETVRRIGCDADINVAVQDETGEVLNYGRTRRLPSPAQRRALVLRDGGCVFPGCDRRPSWTQAHHLWFWRDLGGTDLVNLALVCSFHHHLVHEGRWRLERSRREGAVGWLAVGPDGRELYQQRRPAA